MRKSSLKLSLYITSPTKRLFDILIAVPSLFFSLPLFFLFSILIKASSPGPIFFKQKRVGKGNNKFTILKFRTMEKGAEDSQKKLLYKNEADGPVFKIRNDPRYTKFGKLLSRTGLDELPQLINVLHGKMSLVGPRPLPLIEAKKLTPKQNNRHLVKPGITSSWVIGGAHNLSFNEWMRLDQNYIKNASLKTDLIIILKTKKLILNFLAVQIRTILDTSTNKLI